MMVTRNKTTKNTWDSAPTIIYCVVGEKLICLNLTIVKTKNYNSSVV